MNISAALGAGLGVVFALVCFGVGVQGFMSLDELTDAKTRSDALGFAWFWTGLGIVGVVFGIVSWWIMKGEREGSD